MPQVEQKAGIDGKSNPDISSAEITGTLRCAHTSLSQDKDSQLLVGKRGKQHAQEFMDNYKYPLAAIKISVCAGYMYREVTRLLATGKYDSCISFASGLSLLVYLIAKNQGLGNIKYFDTDLEAMIIERTSRIGNLEKGTLEQDTLDKITALAFDIEKAYKDGKSLKDVFPACKKPVFILDGVSYFLSPECVTWLITQMADYENSAVTMYYWPKSMFESELFKRVYNNLNPSGMIKEQLMSFWDESTVEEFKKHFSKNSFKALAEVEQEVVAAHNKGAMPGDRKLTCELHDPNKFFPVGLVTGEQQGGNTNSSCCCNVS